MYNEVFKRCPKCGALCHDKIPQMVHGFGGFNLDDPEGLAQLLDCEQLKCLYGYVKDLSWKSVV